MEALFKNPGDRVAVHPVLHVYVHCVLYENENPDASSKISSFINVSYDREFRQTPVLERSNFVDVMEVRAGHGVLVWRLRLKPFAGLLF